MDKLFIFAFFHQILNIYISQSSQDSSTSNRILPFVMVKSLGECIEPWDVKLKGPNKRLKFSAGCKYLPPFPKELFFCPIEDYSLSQMVNRVNSGGSTQTVPEHCLFVKQFDRDETPKCVIEPVPEIQKLVTEEVNPQEIKCGPEKVGALYRFQYSLCFISSWRNDIFGTALFFIDKLFGSTFYRPKIEKMNFRIYNFCYDRDREMTIYTEHIILSPDLLNRNELQGEREVVFKTETIGCLHFENDLKQNIVVSSTPQTAIRQQDLTNSIVPHQLVPADDMVFATWKKPTFHSINMKLMPEKLVPLWNYLCHRTRIRAEQNSSIHYKIFTGMFMLPLDDQRNGLIWVKIERNLKTKEELVVVMSDDYVDEILSKYCQVNHCEIPNDHSIPQKVVDFGHHACCCPVTSDVKNLFGLSIHVIDNYQ